MDGATELAHTCFAFHKLVLLLAARNQSVMVRLGSPVARPLLRPASGASTASTTPASHQRQAWWPRFRTYMKRYVLTVFDRTLRETRKKKKTLVCQLTSAARCGSIAFKAGVGAPLLVPWLRHGVFFPTRFPTACTPEPGAQPQRGRAPSISCRPSMGPDSGAMFLGTTGQRGKAVVCFGVHGCM